MKTIVLDAPTVIHGVLRTRGELVTVPDTFSSNVRRVVGRKDIRQAELALAVEIERVENETREREEKERAQPKIITVKVQGPGSVQVEPEQNEYAFGDVVILTAQADDEKETPFLSWQFFVENEKPQTDTNNPTKYTIVSDVMIMALFGKQTPTEDGGLVDVIPPDVKENDKAK